MSQGTFPILLTSVGRRCELVGIFADSIRRIGMTPLIVGVDSSPLAPALHFCDEAVLVPAVDDPSYPDALLELVDRFGVRLVVPLIDTELALQADLRPRIEALGAVSLISSPEVIAITADKYETWRFFSENGIPSPQVCLPGEDASQLGLPVIVKPRFGSSSKHVFRCDTEQDRDERLQTVRNPIAQELARGKELTLDVLADLDGRPLNVVVRERIKTRAGESIIGATIERPDVVEWTERVTETLRPRGPITVQCFSGDDDQLLFTEVNARLGGGYPLADAAGAAYPELVVRMCLGEQIAPKHGEYRVGLAMSRYDRSVIFDLEAGTASPDSTTSEVADRP